MRGTDLNTIERPCDGCGKCLLGVRRLSRVKLATSSPERQRENVLAAAASVGAHIIGWADDWEVSGGTDPVTRPSLGPWLRDEKGPYDGLVAAAVDRLGRNVVDCLNTGYKMRDEKKMLVTYGHDGAWNLDDSADENRFTMEAWGAQMELRAIQRRNRDATVKTRAAGRPKGKPSYGFQYVRKVMGGKIDQVELHPHASEVTPVEVSDDAGVDRDSSTLYVRDLSAVNRPSAGGASIATKFPGHRRVAALAWTAACDRAERGRTAVEQEKAALDLVRRALALDETELRDLRAQHCLGADAVDELARFYELKTYGGAEPDTIQLTPAEFQRAIESDDFFLVVVSGLEAGAAPVTYGSSWSR